MIAPTKDQIVISKWQLFQRMFPWLENEELRSLNYRNTSNRCYPCHGPSHFVRRIYRLEQASGQTPFTGKKSPEGTLLAEPYFQHQVVYVSITVAHLWKLLANDITAKSWGIQFKRNLIKLFEPLCMGRIEREGEDVRQQRCGMRKFFVNIFKPGNSVPFDNNYYIICWAKEGQLNFESIKLFYPECNYINCISANPLREEVKHFFMPPQKTLRYVFGPPPQPKKLTYRGVRKLTGGNFKKDIPTASQEESETETMER